jgi:hypothetical protein
VCECREPPGSAWSMEVGIFELLRNSDGCYWKIKGRERNISLCYILEATCICKMNNYVLDCLVSSSRYCEPGRSISTEVEWNQPSRARSLPKASVLAPVTPEP